MRSKGWIAAFAITACLCAVEAAFFLGDFSPWRRAAAFFWISCSAAVILSTWMFAFATFLDPELWRLKGRAWYLIAFFLPPALVLVDGGGIRFSHIDAEGLQQLAAGVYMMHKDPSFGVYRMSYFTYLTRQYIINGLPTYFLGPSIWASRIGTTMFYLGSYLFFLSAVVTYFRRIRMPDPMFFAGFCGIMISLGQYTLLNARKFEQTTMPIGVTLLVIGAVLLFLSQPSPLNYVWLAWSFGFVPECYTPAIGTWGLALVVLFYLAVRQRKLILIPVIAYGTAALVVAYKVVRRADPDALGIRFRVGIERYTTSDWALRYLHGLRALVGSDYALIPAPLALAIFGAAYLAWRYREYRFAAVGAWALAVTCLSMTFVGSNFNFPSHDIQRALIILPPLALGSLLLLGRYAGECADPAPRMAIIRFFARISMVYMIFTGVSTVFMVRTFFGLGVQDDFDEAFVRINEIVHTPGIPLMRRIYLVPPLKMDIEQGLQYFAPSVGVVRSAPPPGERQPGYWVCSYLSANPDDRFQDEVIPSRHVRPFMKIVPETEAGN